VTLKLLNFEFLNRKKLNRFFQAYTLYRKRKMFAINFFLFLLCINKLKLKVILRR